MKKAVSILLSSVIMLLAIQNTLVYTSFKWNQDYIAQFLCIEKDIQESTCQGSCHLKTELDKVNHTDNNLPVPILNEMEINLLLVEHEMKCLKVCCAVKPKRVVGSDQLIPYFEYIKNCFHPPQLLS